MIPAIVDVRQVFARTTKKSKLHNSAWDKIVEHDTRPNREITKYPYPYETV